MIRALIVDDERLARSAIRASLRAHSEIEVVEECENADQALAAFRTGVIDLLFLDIQMPRKDAFQLLEALGSRPLPAVIFVTAFDHYAVRAFDVYAIDYVLKPFDDDRMAKAIARATDLIRLRQNNDLSQQLRALIEDLKNKPRYAERLAVRSGERTILLPVEQIEWIEANENYVHLHAAKRSHMTRTTMRGLEALLDPRRFVRVSRSAIVNVQCVQECRPLFNGEQTLRLSSGQELKVSRACRQRVQASLGVQL